VVAPYKRIAKLEAQIFAAYTLGFDDGRMDAADVLDKGTYKNSAADVLAALSSDSDG
jgi:hypothetical protein